MPRSKFAIPLAIGITSGLILLLGVFIHILAFPQRNMNGALDLHRGWEACLGSDGLYADGKCQWTSTDLPDVHLQERLSGNFGRQIIYRKNFPTPPICTGSELSGCSFVVGGVYQKAEALLNGMSLGDHFTRSDLYPAIFKVPAQAFRTTGSDNQLILKVQTIVPGVASPAVSQGPVGVYSSDQAALIFAGIVGERIVLPLISAAICLVFALIAVLWMLSKNAPPRILGKYFFYCTSAAVYMLNATRLPKELVNNGVGSSLNCVILFTMHFASLDLILSYFALSTSAILKLRRIYCAAIFMFIVLIAASAFGGGVEVFLSSVRFHTGLSGLREGNIIYELARLLSPLAAVPSLIGLPQSCRSLKHEREDWPLLALFLVLFPMQVLDVLTFMGVIRQGHEIYFVRLYTPFIAIAFGYCIWMRWIQRERYSEAAIKVGEVSAGVAHDLKSPIAVLRVLLQRSRGNDLEAEEMLSGAIRRIDRLSRELLSVYKSSLMPGPALNDDNAFTEIPIPSLIEEVVKIKCADGSRLKSVALDWKYEEPTAGEIIVRGNRDHLLRALENLVKNAIDAKQSGEASIVVNAFRRGQRIAIEVSDNGDGINEGLLRKFNNLEFGITTKHSGHGIGLSYVWRVVQAHGGDLTFRNGPRGGAVVTMWIPAHR